LPISAPSPTAFRGRTLGFFALLTLTACGTVEEVRLSFSDTTPHEAYVQSLQAAGLADAALTKEWTAAAESAVGTAPEVDLPFREEGYLFPAEPGARGYRFSLRRGQQLTVDVALVEEVPARLFLDVFRLRENRDPLPVVSTDSLLTDVTYTAATSGDYVVRLQPELLRGGRYRITLRVGASMTFPVEGHDTGSIQSFFGAERDAGRRSHHGVDIFAPRSTPVLSATDGIVSRVAVTNLGGRVVWIRDDDEPQSIYYAHLDSQLVSRGTRVRKGDPVGLVGNSGNAITTPPHLHFGIYRRGAGPVNPYWFLYHPDGDAPETGVSADRFGRLSRTVDTGIRLRRGPGRGADVLDELPRHTVLRVHGATGNWLRVELPDGRSGYVAARLTEPTSRPLQRTVLEATSALQARPSPEAPAVEDLASGIGVDVLGRYGAYLLVRAGEGRSGWLAEFSTTGEG